MRRGAVRRQRAGILGAAFALAACGVANSTGRDDVGRDAAPVEDSDTVVDSSADAAVSEDSGGNDGATAGDVAAASDGSVPVSDAGGNDGGEPDTAATDGGGGGEMDGTAALDAAGSDAACSPLTGTSFHCYGRAVCSH